MGLKKMVQDEIDNGGGFIYSNQYHVVDVKKGECKFEGIVSDSSLNPYGIVHGAYLFGLADTAGAIAVSSDGHNVVTTSSTIHYIHPAKTKKIIAVAKAIKTGKTVANCRVELFDDKDTLLAFALIEYFYI